ncbi:hypothetical protein [Flavobacterium tyrosinilyticum]|uniref:hypothetical protein n=1 Tax=Flavobacterium tyrosinilyticum TaxID=1658740 RepID=UPI00202E760D|nr:hypothetical protein [Flavobacterium tyrosinilyticum]MCM0665998.1 hypothetical protein [Flavobacterium tyrosinilyticum]
MSTNHNRIRVADLETNQPNKILKTNLNGELEFIDASTLQTDTNNVKLTGNQTIKGEKVFSNTNGNPSLNATVSLSGTAATNFSSTNDGLALYVAGFNNKKEIARIIAIDGSATALNLYNQNSATGDFLKAIDSSNNTVTKVDKDGVVTAKSFVKTGGTNEQFLMADGSVKSVNLQTENYNALDCTTEGKALDARQGKVLKDMIENVSTSQVSLVNDLTTGGTTEALTAEMGKTLENTKLTASLATDAETQITSSISEDKKAVSRSKLFNWWEWLKTKSQTILGDWTFKSSLIFGNSGYFTSDSIRFYMRAYTGKKLQIGVEGVPNDALSIDANGVSLYDKLTLSTGTSAKPALILPNGVLSTVAQNGAIERDSSGKLWTTRNGARYMLTEDDGSYTKILLNGAQMILDTPPPYISTNSVKDTLLGSFPVGTLSNSILAKLTMIAGAGDAVGGGGTLPPTTNKFQIVIKFSNALLNSSAWGPGYISELVLIDNVNITGTTSMISGTYAGWDSNVGIFNGYYVFDNLIPSNPKNLNTVSAQIFCRRLIEFEDATNRNANNQAIRSYTSITSTLVERIRM